MFTTSVSSNKYGVDDILEPEGLECFVCRVEKSKTEEPKLEEAWPDHTIRSSIAITKFY